MAGNQLAPAELSSPEQYVPAPSSADFCYKPQRIRGLREVPSYQGLIPYPIIPSENFPDSLNNTDPYNPRVTRHHEYFLFSSQEYISLGGRALWLSRILYTEPSVHNGRRGLHTFYDMSAGPRNSNERVKALLLSDAGFFPDLGIDLWSGSPEVRPIDSGESAILRKIDPLHQNRYQNLAVDSRIFRDFYDKYLLRQRFMNADYEDISRFAFARKFKQVREIGHQLLQDLIDSTLADFRPEYESLRVEGKLHPLAPIDPAKLIYNSLGDVDLRATRLFPRLRRKAIGYVALNKIKEPLQTGVDKVELQPALS